MSAVTDLIYNVRSDIKRDCPPETLAEYDAALDVICKWEAKDRAVQQINLLWSFNLSLTIWVGTFLFGLWAGYSIQ